MSGWMHGLVGVVVACASSRPPSTASDPGGSAGEVALSPDASTDVQWDARSPASADASTAARAPATRDTEPAAAEFDAAPAMTWSGSSHGCTGKYVEGWLQVRCPLAGDHAGLFDIVKHTWGRFDVADAEVTWTALRGGYTFGWAFDNGIFELASSPTELMWAEVGPWRPGASALVRSAMKGCIARDSARACILQGVPDAASSCKSHRPGGKAFERCLRRRLGRD